MRADAYIWASPHLVPAMLRQSLCVLSALFWLCASAQPAPHLDARAPGELSGQSTPAFEARLLASVNAYRKSQGLALLRASDTLQRIAQDHSRSMATSGRMTHAGFRSRFERANADLCVENLAQGYTVPEQATQGWIASAEHHRNLLEPRIRLVGLAQQGRFITYFACDELL